MSVLKERSAHQQAEGSQRDNPAGTAVQPLVEISKKLPLHTQPHTDRKFCKTRAPPNTSSQ